MLKRKFDSIMPRYEKNIQIIATNLIIKIYGKTGFDDV
jgi:hypothetical protein